MVYLCWHIVWAKLPWLLRSNINGIEKYCCKLFPLSRHFKEQNWPVATWSQCMYVLMKKTCPDPSLVLMLSCVGVFMETGVMIIRGCELTSCNYSVRQVSKASWFDEKFLNRTCFQAPATFGKKCLAYY